MAAGRDPASRADAFVQRLKEKNPAQMLNGIPLENFARIETLFDELQK